MNTPRSFGPARVATWLIGTLAALHVGMAQGQTFPVKPMTLVIATAPGGAMDVTGRLLAERLSVRLGQRMVVENKPGAGSALASQQVAKAPADGYTLLFVSSGYATLPALYPQLPFALSDLAPVAVTASVPYVFVAPSGSPHANIQDFIAYMRTHPKEANFGSGGNATGGHLVGAWFKTQTRLEIEHIPFRGEAPGVQAVLGNQIALMPVTVTVAAPLVRSGKLRALAVSSAQRTPQLPDVPTLAEQNIPVQSSVWFGMLAPAATPRPVIARLNEAINQVLAEPELRGKLQTAGMTIEAGSAADFQKLIERESAQWAGLIKEAGIKAD